MDRRAFFLRAMTGWLAVVETFAARAQIARTVRRIGWLTPGARQPPGEIEQQMAPLRELGWTEGQNLLVVRRYADARPAALQALAKELVRLRVELIVTEGTAAALAAKNATTTIPIVMYTVGDPVGAGLVASLARPAGNITGYSIVSPELDVKRLSLLRELLPSTKRVGELEDSTNPYYRAARKGLEKAYRSSGMEPIFIGVAQAAELDNAIADLARQHAEVLHVPRDFLFVQNVGVIMRAALRLRLPTVVEHDDFFEAGALLSYDFSVAELRRRGAAFIDRILRGAKPADLPIEQPTQFELGINLRTARMLEITVPQSLLLRANRVIQ
jgi:putative ABC transport system substrate-binding protein